MFRYQRRRHPQCSIWRPQLNWLFHCVKMYVLWRDIRVWLSFILSVANSNFTSHCFWISACGRQPRSCNCWSLRISTGWNQWFPGVCDKGSLLVQFLLIVCCWFVKILSLEGKFNHVSHSCFVSFDVIKAFCFEIVLFLRSCEFCEKNVIRGETKKNRPRS